MPYYAMNHCPICNACYNHKKLYWSDYDYDSSKFPKCVDKVCDECKKKKKKKGEKE